MQESRVIFHVGMPKSASTTLQKNLFPKLENYIYVGLAPTNNIGNDKPINTKCFEYFNNEHLKPFYDYLHRTPETTFQIERLQTLAQLAFGKYRHEDNLILSHEAMTSTFFSHTDVVAKAQRIKLIMPTAKILLILRNQIDWLESQYRDHPFEPENPSKGKPLSFNAWLDQALNSRKLPLRNQLDYWSLISQYRTIFGKSNIHICLFEDLIFNLSKFCADLGSVFDTTGQQLFPLLNSQHENRGVSNVHNKVRHIERHFGPQHPLSQISLWLAETLKFKQWRKRAYIPSKQSLALITSLFETGNNKLARELDLKKYRYPGC